ncbi:MAG TPA: alpha/beta hydrolase, partial [Vicinamibacteria bacterium]|nr:alpha/beta hydrolase [Vicinamibacteria bacterium]
LHIWCMGSGSPAVVLEAGLSGSTSGGGFVQPEVARFTRVCAYDRAGLGYSDPGPSPRTAGRIAHELARLLDRAGIVGPVVLAGASIGGLYARVFTSEHPERVAGLVLVDASHERQEMEVPRLARVVPLLAPLGVFRLLGVSFARGPDSLAPSTQAMARATRFRTAGYLAAASEIAHVRQSAAEAETSRRKLAVPVMVVTAGRGTDAAWRELQRDLVGLSERGCQVIAEESGHVVTADQPQVVVEAIRTAVMAARGSSDILSCDTKTLPG